MEEGRGGEMEEGEGGFQEAIQFSYDKKSDFLKVFKMNCLCSGYLHIKNNYKVLKKVQFLTQLNTQDIKYIREILVYSIF